MHTQGPWTLRPVTNVPHVTAWVDGPDGAPVADIKMRQREQSDDNARLIAAAPDLLIALTTMVMNYEDAYGDEGADAPESVKAAKVAIRKATSP